MDADIGTHPYWEESTFISLLVIVCKKIPMNKYPIDI